MAGVEQKAGGKKMKIRWRSTVATNMLQSNNNDAPNQAAGRGAQDVEGSQRGSKRGCISLDHVTCNKFFFVTSTIQKIRYWEDQTRVVTSYKIAY